MTNGHVKLYIKEPRVRACVRACTHGTLSLLNRLAHYTLSLHMQLSVVHRSALLFVHTQTTSKETSATDRQVRNKKQKSFFPETLETKTFGH